MSPFTFLKTSVSTAMLRIPFLLALFTAVNLSAQPLDQYGWTFYDTLNKSIPDNTVADICMDKKGRVWVTMGNMSMSCWERGRWRTIEARKPDSMVYGWLRDMALLKNGNLAISGIPGKLAFYNPEKNNWQYHAMPQRDLQPLAIYADDRDVLLVGTMNGLYQYHNGIWKKLITGYGDVMGISGQVNGNVMATLREGMFLLRKRSNAPGYVLDEQIRDQAFYEAVTDRKGRLWAASYEELNVQMLEDTTWTRFNELPQQIYYNFNGTWKYVVHNVALLHDGRPVISTQFGAHLAVYNAGEWLPYSVPLNGEFDGIECIRLGPDNSIWLGTWHHGVVVLSPNRDSTHRKVVPRPQPLPVIPGQQQPIQRPGHVPSPAIIHKLIDD